MRWQPKAKSPNPRSNDEHAPRAVVVSQARLTVAYLLDAARRRLQQFVKPTPIQRPQRRTVTLIDARGFTTLGASIAPQPIGQQTRCAFPELDPEAARVHSKPLASAHWLPLASNDPGHDPSAHVRDR